MGMLELGGEEDLAAEPVHADAGGELGGEHLDHDPPPERGLERDEDAGHPAAAEFVLELIGLAERGLKLFTQIERHGPSQQNSTPTGPRRLHQLIAMAAQILITMDDLEPLDDARG